MLSYLIRRLIYVAIHTLLLNVATIQFYMIYSLLCTTWGSIFLHTYVFYVKYARPGTEYFLELD
jgi:hypothetical protein